MTKERQKFTVNPYEFGGKIVNLNESTGHKLHKRPVEICISRLLLAMLSYTK